MEIFVAHLICSIYYLEPKQSTKHINLSPLNGNIAKSIPHAYRISTPFFQNRGFYYLSAQSRSLSDLTPKTHIYGNQMKYLAIFYKY